MLERLKGKDGIETVLPLGAPNAQAQKITPQSAATTPGNPATRDDVTKTDANDAQAPKEIAETQDVREAEQDTGLSSAPLSNANKPANRAAVKPAIAAAIQRLVTPLPQAPVGIKGISENDPSAEDDKNKRRLRDISYMVLGGTEAQMAEKMANRDEDNVRSYGYGFDGDGNDHSGEYDEYADNEVWDDAFEQNNYLIYNLQNDISDNDYLRGELAWEIEQEDQEIENLGNEINELTGRRDSLINEAADAEHGVVNAERYSAQTSQAFEAKLREKYPNGEEPAYGQADPVRDAEQQLRDDAYAQHREEILQAYREKGLEQEFLTLENASRQPGADQTQVQEALSKVQQAGMPYDPNMMLVDILRRDDPNNEYLQTLHAARVDVQKSWDQTSQAAGKYAEMERKDVGTEIERMDTRLREINERLSSVEERRELNAKELRKMEEDRVKLTERLKQAEDYKTWLNSDQTKAGLSQGTVKLADFKANAPKFMDDGAIDTGDECVMPNTARGRVLAEQINAQATSRTGTSASGSGFQAPEVQAAFNEAAPNQVAAAEISPTQARPEEPRARPQSLSV